MADKYLLEDGSGFYLLEDGSGVLLTEVSVPLIIEAEGTCAGSCSVLWYSDNAEAEIVPLVSGGGAVGISPFGYRPHPQPPSKKKSTKTTRRYSSPPPQPPPPKSRPKPSTEPRHEPVEPVVPKVVRKPVPKKVTAKLPSRGPLEKALEVVRRRYPTTLEAVQRHYPRKVDATALAFGTSEVIGYSEVVQIVESSFGLPEEITEEEFVFLALAA